MRWFAALLVAALLFTGCGDYSEKTALRAYDIINHKGEVEGESVIFRVDIGGKQGILEEINISLRESKARVFCSFLFMGDYVRINRNIGGRLVKTAIRAGSGDTAFSVRTITGCSVSRAKVPFTELGSVVGHFPLFVDDNTNGIMGLAGSVYLWERLAGELCGEFRAYNTRGACWSDYISEKRHTFDTKLNGKDIAATRFFTQCNAVGHTVYTYSGDGEEQKLLYIDGFASGYKAALQGFTAPQRNRIKPPPSIIETEVAIPSEGVTLGGTLSRPTKGVKFPAALIVHGSGPVDRDGNSIGMTVDTYRQLAHFLSANGYVVLRYDKRGVGASKLTTDEKNPPLPLLASDAGSCVGFLSSNKYVNGNITVIGHSEGGYIATMLAAGNEAVSGAITLAGPASRLDDILRQQLVLISRAHGLSEKRIKADARRQNALLLIAEKAPLDKLRGKGAAAGTEWLRSHIEHNPTAVLKKLSVPLLAIYGAHDLQVPPAEEAVLKKILADNKNCEFESAVIPRLDHLLMETKSNPCFGEYADPDRLVSEKLLNTILQWLARAGGRSAGGHL